MVRPDARSQALTAATEEPSGAKRWRTCAALRNLRNAGLPREETARASASAPARSRSRRYTRNVIFWCWSAADTLLAAAAQAACVPATGLRSAPMAGTPDVATTVAARAQAATSARVRVRIPRTPLGRHSSAEANDRKGHMWRYPARRTRTRRFALPL